MIVKMGYMLQKEERRMGGGNVSQDQTSIICIDLKSFYASVECVERGLNPFKTNLVVADPTRSKSTICLAIIPQKSMESICGMSQKKISMCTVLMSVLLM